MNRKLSDADLQRLAELVDAGLSCREIAPRLGVSVATTIRWVKRSGLTSRRSRRLPARTRAALLSNLREDASPQEAAARCGVSLATAERLRAALDRGSAAAGREGDRRASARDRAHAAAAMEAGMSAEQAARTFNLSATAVARIAASRRFAPDRQARRRRLMAALAQGLSRRGAAAVAGVPVATAIRWARTMVGHLD